MLLTGWWCFALAAGTAPVELLPWLVGPLVCMAVSGGCVVGLVRELVVS
jgi:hypothetical protein